MKGIKDFPKKEYINYLFHEFEKIQDPQLIILKGHILLEYILNIYLSSHTNVEDHDFSKEKFNFYEKTRLLYLFGSENDIIESIYEGFNLLNKIRNNISHDLSYQETDIENLLEYGLTVFDWNYQFNTDIKNFFKQINFETGEIDGIKIDQKNINEFKDLMFNWDFDTINKKLVESEQMKQSLNFRNDVKRLATKHKLFFSISTFIITLYTLTTIKTGNISDFLNSFPDDYNEKNSLFKFISGWF